MIKSDIDKLEALRDEIDLMKSRRPESKSKVPEQKDVTASMEKLTETLNNFMKTFEEATDEMKLEEKEEELFIRELKPLHEKMGIIIEQNEKIGKGIIAVANMLNSDIPFIKRMVTPSSGGNRSMFEPQKLNFGEMPQMQRPMAPRSMESPNLTGAPMPSPPRPGDNKKKFSNLFK